jgi:hypothetical protein
MVFRRKTICNLHDEIKDWATKICDIKLRHYETAEDAFTEAQDYANQILNIIDDAKVDGEKMEERLIEYREAIEGLGFERKK